MTTKKLKRNSVSASEYKAPEIESSESLETAVDETPPATQPVKVRTPKPPVVPQKPRVDFRVWAISSGIKLDQLAGFARYAEKQDMGPRTIPEWREALSAFLNRPTR